MGGMVDESPADNGRQDSALDFLVKLMDRLIEVENSLSVPTRFMWTELDGTAMVGTDATGSNVWGVSLLDNPNLAAIKLSVEQMVYDAKSSDEAQAVVEALQRLHASENETCQSLDRIGRRDSITGSCPDCAI